ncbi:MAG: SRPBCC family protein [Chthoniobacterales bacterium]|nr:SRPBCC family protein [Chthoniobacterales bacterium]
MSLHIDEDRIEKQIELKAPRARVWRALTDYREFGAWFGVKLENPFVPQQTSRGQITYPGYEHVRMEVITQKLEPEGFFSFTWHPYAIDPQVDYSTEKPTLVEFTLEEISGGTLLKVVETGFKDIPAHRRTKAFRMNNDGWEEQMENIAKHVSETK